MSSACDTHLALVVGRRVVCEWFVQTLTFAPLVLK